MGESAGLEHSEFDDDGKVSRGFQQPALAPWPTHFLPAAPKQWSQQVVLLICSTKDVAQSDEGTQQGAGQPAFSPKINGLTSPGSWSAPTQAGELNQSPALCGV